MATDKLQRAVGTFATRQDAESALRELRDGRCRGKIR